MRRLAMEEFFAGATSALIDAQLELDERGRDSIDAFDQTGIPPTVFSWGRCRLTCPVSVGVVPRRAAAERTRAKVAPRGTATVALALRYLASPQGGESPAPLVPEELAWTSGDADREATP